ncbi:MAG TPA: hypothetical protein VIO58_05250 [Candidatus Methanoperedens sp.]
MVSIMLIRESKKISFDWDALDKHWSNAYEADYGHFFSDTPVERLDLRLSISTITRGRTPVESLF